MIEVLEKMFKPKQIPDEVIKHADIGDFELPENPKRSILPGKMKGGGHGQANIDYLEQIGRKYKIEHTYKNGVRIGAVE
ncbi:hypothetical protein [Flavobacterium sp. J27]|uniref:hypothetical protein n=1 Tax=Flavobacterium sp. J27 TaxID=2060419 RepID=UPI00197A79B0|nr:hypothetical protein [Flavobacterium sp. J27]